MKCKEIVKQLEHLSPASYAMNWDNVGLLAGDDEQEIHHILVALDCNNAVIDEAVRIGADMIVTHHPIIFGGLKSVTNKTLEGSRVLKLLSNGICGYSMHTNFDVKGGMAELAAEKIGIIDTVPIEITNDKDSVEGIGRIGTLAGGTGISVSEWCDRIKTIFCLENVILYGKEADIIYKAAVCPGSGKDFIKLCVNQGVQLLITGDINHHSGIDAVDMGLNVIDAGHYGLEVIFVDYLVNYLKDKCDGRIKVTGMNKEVPFKII